MRNETGATPEQIDDAAWTIRDLTEDGMKPRDIAVHVLSALVPPGQVITDAARMPRDDELAAMRRCLDFCVDPGAGLKSSDARLLREYLERQR